MTGCPAKRRQRSGAQRPAAWPRPRGSVILLILVFLAGAGCAGGGDLVLRNAVDPGRELSGDFTTAVYSLNNHNELDVLLIEGPADDPSQAVHIRMHWRPRAGSTPVARFATNATVRYAIFAGRSAGVYDGAGFLFPHNRPGGGVFSGELRSASLRLADSSDRFVDRLGLAEAIGSFSARRDDAATLRVLRQLQERLTREMGYPRFVQGPASPGRSALGLSK